MSNEITQRICDALDSIDVSLRLMAKRPEGRDWHAIENQAIGLLVVHGPNVSRIADDLGVRRATLYDPRTCPRFSKAVDAIRQRKA